MDYARLENDSCSPLKAELCKGSKKSGASAGRACLVYTIGWLVQTRMGFQPKRKSRGPDRVGEILKTFFDDKLPKTMGDETRVFGAWAKAVGQDVSRQASPVTFRNGILFVETRHPVWTIELTSKRHLIQRKLNEALGKEVVREIHFRQAKG
jgi:predicted nucleic acid-binding Zn ribbon protein